MINIQYIGYIIPNAGLSSEYESFKIKTNFLDALLHAPSFFLIKLNTTIRQPGQSAAARANNAAVTNKSVKLGIAINFNY